MNVVNDGCAPDITVTVRVTGDEIKRGVPNKSRCCPVALAFIELGFSNVKVARRQVSGVRDMHTYFGYFPPLATGFITNIDGGEDVTPIEFTIVLSQDWGG